jgi:redox-sensing transcriptional repressor
MKIQIPQPAIARLCSLYQLLDSLEREGGQQQVSSTDLGELLATGSYTIRKDINYLGEIGNVGSGYEIGRLKNHIAARLQIGQPQRACIVGLGRLGGAILEYDGFVSTSIQVIAAFDTNTNRLETLHTTIPLYPAFEMTDVVQAKKIELAILAVPAAAAQECAERLMAGGVRGIVNFTQAVIRTADRHVHVKNVDVLRELIILSTLIRLDETNIDTTTETV